MEKTIKVKAIWEFEFNAEGYDEKCVDVLGLAKDSTQRELKSMIDNTEINAGDFNYLIDEKPENKKVKIKLSDGRELVAEVNNYDGNHEEIVVYIEAENSTQDICLVRKNEKEPERTEVFVWGDEENEDYTDSFDIGKYEESFEETCPHCDHINEYKVLEAKDYKNGKKIVVCRNCGSVIFACNLCDCDGCEKCYIEEGYKF